MTDGDEPQLREESVARDLVERIRAGDSRAENELVLRYSRGVLFLLRRMTRDPTLADDLHQDTFQVVLQRLRGAGIDDPARVSGFIRATARNLFIGEVRKRERRRTDRVGEHSGDVADPTPGPLTRVLRDEEASLVRRVISELGTERDRQLLFRFYVAEHDKSLICAELGLTSLHFNRVLHRARQRFKELLESRRQDPTTPGEPRDETLGGVVAGSRRGSRPGAPGT